jgi:L-asparaginase II
MSNPLIAEITRGPITESRHTGAFAVVDAAGHIISGAGDIERAIYPRSAIKAFQCLPLIETGAADRFGLTPDEVALCCASHNGEEEHVRVARSILAKAGRSDGDLECGAHWPSDHEAQRRLIERGEKPTPLHNNCSGKHAGMLALASHLGVDPKGYVAVDHPVQEMMAASLSKHCGIDVRDAPWGVDGCSVPSWAIPLRATALGFARLTERAEGRRIIESVRVHPFMVGGSASFDTRLMQAVPRAFIKVGAEGVYGACVPHADLGVALKIDDGASRAAEVAVAGILASLDVWQAQEKEALASFARRELRNWRMIHTGDISAVRF